MAREEITQNADHEATFKAITANKAGNFHLIPMYVNDELSSAIVSINPIKDSEDYALFPFFVAITPGMVLRDVETGIEITGEEICSVLHSESGLSLVPNDEPPKTDSPNSMTKGNGNDSSNN